MITGNSGRRNQMLARAIQQQGQPSASTDMTNQLVAMGLSGPHAQLSGQPTAMGGSPGMMRPPHGVMTGQMAAPMGQPPPAGMTPQASAQPMGQPSPDQMQRAQLAMRLFGQRRQR